MLEGAKNKMQQRDEIKADSIRAVGPVVNEYHFPGNSEWEAMSVRAATIQDAQAIYKDKRKPVNPEKKVEEENQSNAINE